MLPMPMMPRRTVFMRCGRDYQFPIPNFQFSIFVPCRHLRHFVRSGRSAAVSSSTSRSTLLTQTNSIYSDDNSWRVCCGRSATQPCSGFPVEFQLSWPLDAAGCEASNGDSFNQNLDQRYEDEFVSLLVPLPVVASPSAPGGAVYSVRPCPTRFADHHGRPHRRYKRGGDRPD